ncbi:GlcG/HbpS family heme-binding protein [Mycolicibacterium obuense]|nr:heme-binding protein [Mycolicibacterium obuense]
MTQTVAAQTAADAPDLVRASDMSLAVAERLLAGVKAQASARGLRLAAAVVDRGGNVVASMRMDNAQLGASSLAHDKAVTAVSFGRPTSAWTASSAPGGSDWGLAHTLGGHAVVFPGGVPVFSDAELVGGLGVSGAASEVDAACATGAVHDQGLTVDTETSS